MGGTGIQLCMIGVFHFQNISGVFHKRVLEAGAGTQKRYVPFASKLDSIQRADRVFVWASGDAPDAVIRGKLISSALDL